MKKSHFSIAVKGNGILLNPFITDGCAAFPGAVWYDRSDSTNAFIQQEVMLGAKGFLRQKDRASAKRAGENLANPKPTDVTVTFSAKGYNNEVVIEGRRRKRELSINTADMSMKKLDRFLARIIHAVEKVL